MNRKDIEEVIIRILKEDLDISVNTNLDTTSVLSNLGIDSIAMMTFFVFIEEKFEFTVDEDILISNSFVTVSDVVDYVEKKVG